MAHASAPPAEPRRFARWLSILLALIVVLAVVALLVPDRVFLAAGLTAQQLDQPVTARETAREALLVIVASAAVGCALLLALFGAFPTLREPVVLLGAILIALLVHTLTIARVGWTPDDAFINFTYARNLAHHGRFAFNLGERAGGYSSWLLALALTPFAWLPHPRALATVARGLALVASLPTVSLLYALARRLDRERPAAWSLAAPLLVTLYPGYLLCTATALETQLVTFLVTLGAFLYLGDGRRGWCVLAFVLAALARADAVVFLVATGAFAVVDARRAGRPLAKAAAPWLAGLVATLALWLVAVVQQGSWVSSAFVASGGFRLSGARLLRGGYYVGSFLKQTAGVTVFLVPLAVAARRLGRAAAYALVLIGAGLATTTFLGGDPLPAHRLAAVVAPLLFLVLQESAYGLYAWATPARGRGATGFHVVLALAFVLAYPVPYVRREVGVVRELRAQRAAARGTEALAWALRRDGDGAVAAFEAGRLRWLTARPTIDLSGKCAGEIAARGADAAAYVLAREPRYIVLTAAASPPDTAATAQPLWPIERRIEQAQDFRRRYAFVRSFTRARPADTVRGQYLLLYERAGPPGS